MEQPFLIIITGAPGTGKTTLAKKISAKYSLPLIVKDKIKEILFNNIGYDLPGWDPDAWQKALGRGSIEVMHYVSEEMLKKGISHILESNFVPQFANEKFKDMKKKYGCDMLQIYCHAEIGVLIDRFEKRVASPERHSGHAEHTYMAEFKDALEKARFSPLDIDSDIINIDMTNFDFSENEIYKKIDAFLKTQHLS